MRLLNFVEEISIPRLEPQGLQCLTLPLQLFLVTISNIVCPAHQNACYFCPKDGARQKDAALENFSLCPRRYVNYPISYKLLLLSLPQLCTEYCRVISISRILRQKSRQTEEICFSCLLSEFWFKVRFLISTAALVITTDNWKPF